MLGKLVGWAPVITPSNVYHFKIWLNLRSALGFKSGNKPHWVGYLVLSPYKSLKWRNITLKWCCALYPTLLWEKGRVGVSRDARKGTGKSVPEQKAQWSIVRKDFVSVYCSYLHISFLIWSFLCNASVYFDCGPRKNTQKVMDLCLGK